jgi:hypothetical protein
MPVNWFLSRLYCPNMKPTSREPTLMSPAGTSVFSPMWRASSVMNAWQNRMTCGWQQGGSCCADILKALSAEMVDMHQIWLHRRDSLCVRLTVRQGMAAGCGTSLSERPLGLKSLPPLPPPIGSVVREFLNTYQ